MGLQSCKNFFGFPARSALFYYFFGFLQSHGNIAKWLKKEGDKVGFILFLADKTPVYDIECGISVTDLNFGYF